MNIHDNAAMAGTSWPPLPHVKAHWKSQLALLLLLLTGWGVSYYLLHEQKAATKTCRCKKNSRGKCDCESAGGRCTCGK